MTKHTYMQHAIGTEMTVNTCMYYESVPNPYGACEVDPSLVELANSVTMVWILWIGLFHSTSNVFSITAIIFWATSSSYHFVNFITKSYHKLLHRADLATNCLCVLTCCMVTEHIPIPVKLALWGGVAGCSFPMILYTQNRTEIASVAFIFNLPILIVMLVFAKNKTWLNQIMCMLSIICVAVCKVFEHRYKWLWPLSRLPSFTYAYFWIEAMGVSPSKQVRDASSSVIQFYNR